MKTLTGTSFPGNILRKELTVVTTCRCRAKNSRLDIKQVSTGKSNHTTSKIEGVMMKVIIGFCAICFLIFLPVAGHSSNGTSPVKTPTPPSKAPHAESSLSGTVVETMDSGGYTYINLDSNGKKIWVAVPKMSVKVGQKISLYPGTEMGTFTSKSLHRTFDNIIFSAGPIRSRTSGSTSGGNAFHNRNTGHITTVVPAGKIKVEKASGPNAYTVGELYKNRGRLDKKSVVVRGQVVKVLSNIMGKNWIHLQDGSGNPSEKSNDLVVTSRDLPAVGETVTAKGTLRKDKNFGSGYKYNIIVEDASISK